MNRLSAPLSRSARVARGLILAVLIPATISAWAVEVPSRLPAAYAVQLLTPRPTPQECADYRSPHRVPTTGSADPAARLRVFAVGYHLDIDHAASYDTWRTAMRCIMQDEVVPNMKPGVPTLVVFPEDIGLPTISLGARGATVRAQAQSPLRAVSEGVPLSMAAALLQLNTAYAPQIAAYQARFAGVDPRKQLFLAATDTMVRAFSQTFSEIAKDYGVYVVASNNQARYRVTHNPLEVLTFADPALQPTDTAYVATEPRVTNSTFLWGPADVSTTAQPFERNLLLRNEKVPLTSLETDLLALDPGPATGPAALANAGGVTVAGYKLGFATSLPAFQYGYPFGERPPGFAPCADLTITFAACQDAQGVDVMIQADANPGRWVTAAQSGGWQPLEWMGSTWRAVADPTVRFGYNVTAMMTGNLFDLVFDGQSAITARGGGAPGRHYVGTSEVGATDPPEYAVYAGDKTEFLALAPWVTPDASRADLVATGAQLAGGSGAELENAYVEAVVFADFAS